MQFVNYKAREAKLRLELEQARADAASNIEAAQRAAAEQAARGAAQHEQGLLASQAKQMRLQLLSMLTVQADALGAGEWLRDMLTEYATMNGAVPLKVLQMLLECSLPAAVARLAARERLRPG